MEPTRYTYLKHAFANDVIDVVFDRRVADRRRNQESIVVEKRRGERRQRDITRDLKELGWALVRRQARTIPGQKRWVENDRPARNSPGSLLARIIEVIDLSGNAIPVSGLSQRLAMDGSAPRDVGRASRRVSYSAQVAVWLREGPTLSGVE